MFGLFLFTYSFEVSSISAVNRFVCTVLEGFATFLTANENVKSAVMVFVNISVTNTPYGPLIEQLKLLAVLVTPEHELNVFDKG